MRPRHAPSRPAAARWCAIALLVALALPALHTPHGRGHNVPPDSARAGHVHHPVGCRAHAHHTPAPEPAQPPRPHDPQHHDHDCPVCHVIHVMSTGAPQLAAPAALCRADSSIPLPAIREALPPAQRITPTQRTPRGPPAA